MKVKKGLLNIDVIIQSFLWWMTAIIAVVTLITMGEAGLILAYTLLFLGWWQLGSGAIMGIILKDNTRGIYFFGSIFYLLLIAILGSVLLHINEILDMLFISIFITIIPLGIGYWYLRLTKESLRKLNSLDDEIEITNEFDNILDSDEIYKLIEK